jgi:hypothetical protein
MNKTVTLAAALALLAFACEDRVHAPTPTPEPTGAESPVEVLETVEKSFNERDTKLLVSSLSENFVFYFDPDDVGQNPPGSEYIIPESWNRTEFWTAVENMFTKAYSISLTIPTGNVGTPGENETTYRADIISISLLVMVDELNGYIADTGYCNYEFESYTSEAGKKCWGLTGWWDRTAIPADARLGLKPSSVGRILATFK